MQLSKLFLRLSPGENKVRENQDLLKKSRLEGGLRLCPVVQVRGGKDNVHGWNRKRKTAEENNKGTFGNGRSTITQWPRLCWVPMIPALS